MVEYLGNINGVSLYTDPYMEDNKFIRGRKENKSFFLIANPKTGNIFYKNFLMTIRKKKLEKINSL